MESGGIYIALWRRPAEAGNTSVHQTFHWGLVIARNPTGRDSTCCHVVGGMSTWAYETKEPYNALQSLLALRFCRIGSTDDINRTVRIIESVPVSVNSKTFTCRTWTMDAVGELNKAGIVLCRDRVGLERELWQLGASAILAEQQDQWSITDIRWAHNCRHPPYN